MSLESKIHLKLKPLNLISEWNRCSLTANFLSEFQLSTTSNSNNKHLKNTLSTIINELLENAIKYSINKDHELNFSTSVKKKKITLEFLIICDKTDTKKLIHLLEMTKKKEANEIINDILENDTQSDDTALVLSLLFIKNHYNVIINFNIQNNNEDGQLKKINITVEIDTSNLLKNDI